MAALLAAIFGVYVYLGIDLFFGDESQTSHWDTEGSKAVASPEFGVSVRDGAAD